MTILVCHSVIAVSDLLVRHHLGSTQPESITQQAEGLLRRKKLMQALVDRDHATLATLMSQQAPAPAPAATTRSSFAEPTPA